jgi:endonuclease/exonuclease/phosphatase family metal-dependent hydrolase
VETDAANGKISVVSWNIRFGIEIDRAIAELRDIEEIPLPDILLLQEMDEDGTAAIAQRLDADYFFTSIGPHKQSDRDFGNAIISPWPISHGKEIKLPHKSKVGGHPRSASRATLDVAGTEILTYSVHTEVASLGLQRRIKQFRCVADDINHSVPLPVIVGGDFNTVTDRGVTALKRTMAEAGLDHVSTDAGASFRRARRDIPLDHVFASGFWAAASGVSWSATASDHMPMWVELVPDESDSSPTRS